MGVPNAQQQVTTAVITWEGTSTQPHRFGGTEYLLGKRELGHIHGDRLVDIPFPTRVRDEVVAAGLAEPHHLLVDSGWVSCYLRTPADVDRAIGLLRRSYDLARAKWTPAVTPMAES
jgi:Family of unknown function (DUF5519)